MIDKISLYRSFACVAEYGSISAAAKNLYVTQPAISADILSLEDALGIKLFFRTNRGVTLTNEGKVLYDYVRSAFSFINSGEEALKDITGLRTGELRIGASDMTLRFYLLDYIEKFFISYPKIKLKITNNPTPQTLAALKKGLIDFGIITEPLDLSEAETENIEAIPVRQIEDIFVASPKLKISQCSAITPSQLVKYPIIMLEKQTSTRKYLKMQTGYEHLEADIELSTSDLITEFACRGMGIASIVKDFATEPLLDGRLCQLDLAQRINPRNMLLVYLKKLPLTSSAKAIISLMTEGKNVTLQ